MKNLKSYKKRNIISKRLFMIIIAFFICIIVIFAIRNDYSKIYISFFPVKIELWKKVQSPESEEYIMNIELELPEMNRENEFQKNKKK